MAPRMTLAEIERTYPGEWVVVLDFVRDGRTLIREGVVIFHTTDRQAALRTARLVGRNVACWHVGRPRPALGGLLGVVL